MHSYEQAIFEFILEHPQCSRAQVIGHFHQLSDKTIYRNIIKLKQKRIIVEDKYHGLSAAPSDEVPKDTWPLIKALNEFMNVTEITNAFANQDDLAKEKLVELSHKYGQELAILLVNITVLSAFTKGSDIYKGYKTKTPVNHDILNREINMLEQIGAALQKVYNTAA